MILWNLTVTRLECKIMTSICTLCNTTSVSSCGNLVMPWWAEAYSRGSTKFTPFEMGSGPVAMVITWYMWILALSPGYTKLGGTDPQTPPHLEDRRPMLAKSYTLNPNPKPKDKKRIKKKKKKLVYTEIQTQNVCIQGPALASWATVAADRKTPWMSLL